MSIKSQIERLEKRMGDEEERVIISIISPYIDASPEEVEAIAEEQAKTWVGWPTAFVVIEQEDVDAYRRRHGGGQ